MAKNNEPIAPEIAPEKKEQKSFSLLNSLKNSFKNSWQSIKNNPWKTLAVAVVAVATGGVGLGV